MCVCVSLLFIYLDIKLFISSFIHAQPLNFDRPREFIWSSALSSSPAAALKFPWRKHIYDY